MTNITELKEKLTKFDDKEVFQYMNETFAVGSGNYKQLCGIDGNFVIDGAKHQHSQDAKTITALLSIIEEMQKCALEVIEDGSKPIGDLGGYFIADEKYNNLLETLTATEQKLKELGENK